VRAPGLSKDTYQGGGGRKEKKKSGKEGEKHEEREIGL